MPSKLISLALLTLPVCLSAHSGDFHTQLVPADQTTPAVAKCSITVEDGIRIIESNGIPNHLVGAFPNRRNPHEIEEQTYRFQMPAAPEIADEPTPLVRQAFGIAVNGVTFHPGTAEYYKRDRNSEWNYEALSGKKNLGLDANHAHVQPNGAYHYHGLPTALFDELSGGEKRMTLVGWAADGFPIYGLYGYSSPENPGSGVIELKSSYRVKEGERPSGSDSPGGQYDGTYTIDYEYIEGIGDLDECGGRFGVTPEFPEGTYYYVLTEDYPFIPRMFRGTPDKSFERRHGNRPLRR